MKSDQKKALEKINSVLQEIISGGTISAGLDDIPDNLPEEYLELANNVKTLTTKVKESQEFILALASGKLRVLPPKQNNFIAPLKQLHSDLLHLTWQTKEIAEGDYSQNVSFMGDFSVAFNKMIVSLKERRKLEDGLKESNATKDKFFSIIAHDLINPIGTFVSLTEHMLNDFEIMGIKSIENNLIAIYKSSKSTYELLENLLTWSRSQRGTIPFNPTNSDLRFITDQCVHILSEVANKKKIKLNSQISCSLMANCDSNMITTVLRNLISNAIKFTPESGTITIIGHHNAEEKQIQVCVQDTGIGIPPQNIPKLFAVDQSFTTNGTNDEKGTGLGLILCKEFIEKNEGEIWVESEVGKGSRFCFKLTEAIETKVDLSELFT